MRILIAGMDGYLGWSLSVHLAVRGHEVFGADRFLRRRWVREMGSDSAIEIAPMAERLAALGSRCAVTPSFREGDLCDYEFVCGLLAEARPDAIVHLGEMPSAPYSMIDVEHCTFTHRNNLIGTLNLLFAMREVAPQAHLLKLGTMGEYGTPPIDIPEGFFDIEYRGREARLPFPRQAGSWYHQTKVHDSHNIMFACRIWGLRSTDVMQGVVYGTRIAEMEDDPRLATRLDYDQAFGTAINRFCCQAVVDEPLTLFGSGHQKRGFLPLRESIECMRLALENPPEQGEYRVLNQFAEVCTIEDLAEKVRSAAESLGLEPRVHHIENPRIELEEHYYNPDHKTLFELGYEPRKDMAAELTAMLEDLLASRARIEVNRDCLVPDIRWDGTRRNSRPVETEPDGEPSRADSERARS